MSPRRQGGGGRRMTLDEVLDELRRIVTGAQSGKATGGVDVSLNWQDGHILSRQLTRRDYAHVSETS